MTRTSGGLTRSVILCAALMLVLSSPSATAQWVPCSAGSETCTQSASVGIATGTTSPGPLQKLDVNGNIRVNQFIYSPASYSGFLADNNSALPIKAGSMVLADTYSYSAPANGLFVQGRVGIGQPTPDASALLHVEGAAVTSVPGQALVVVKNTHGSAGDQFGLAFRNAGFTGSAAINSYLDAGGATSRLQFLTGGSAPSVALTIDGSQNVGIGVVPNGSYRLEVSGNANFSGIVTGSQIHATYQDIAEWVFASEDLAPGTVVVLNPDETNVVMRSRLPYDTSVAGVVSANPGLVLGVTGPSKTKIATTGRVHVFADASRAAIRVGDLLVTSDVPGVAMKSEPIDLSGVKLHRPGTIIGKALEPLDRGRGSILLLLSLQ